MHGWAVGDNGALLRYKPLHVSVDEGPAFSMQKPEVIIYPNPSKGNTTIQISNSRAIQNSKFKIQNSKFILFNAIGEEVMILSEGSFLPGEHQFNFDAQGLPAGIYYCLLLVDGKKAGATKLVVLE
jgi:hypothetical protein